MCAAAAILLAAACAHIEAPTGGPTDSIAPALVSTRPDTNAVLQGWTGPAVFVFSEGLSEQGVEQAVTLSPRRGPTAVDKEGDEIRVRPRRGWEPGLIYQVEIAPGLRDRFSNVTRERYRLVFSTGPAIPDTRAAGRVTDRITGQVPQEPRVDALRLGDSLVYTTQPDSAGRYTLAQVPEGDYRLIAYRDANRNFRVDAFEQRDTVLLTITAGQAPTADFALVPNDTTAPVAGSARITDDWVEIRFDDYLDPDQTVAPEQVTLIGPDGAAVALGEVRIGPPPAARDTSDADSTVADTGAARPGQPPARPGQRPGPPVARDTAGADSAAADTVPTGPLPSQSLFARPAAPLVPDTLYTVRVRDVRNVNGLVGGGEAPLRTPRPPPPPPPPTDSAAAGRPAVAPPDSTPADSAAVPPPASVDSAAVPVPAVVDTTAADTASADTAAVDTAVVDTAAPPPAMASIPPARRAPAAPERRADARGVMVPRGRE